MEREEALEKLSQLEGLNLHDLAKELGVGLLGPSMKINKGWAGHTFEHYLGLPINSAQSPNFGSWELKVIPLKTLQNGKVTPKETMAITMIDPWQVARTPFEDSHLLSKLKKAVIVARTVGKTVHDPSYVYDVRAIDTDPDGEFYETIREDYNIVQECINDPERGFKALTGAMGTLVQPRTKGAGHGSISRAFYARTTFLAKLFDL